jgi:hypothetical protein
MPPTAPGTTRAAGATLALAAIALSMSALCAAAASLADQVRSCAAERTDSARLACFDRLAAAVAKTEDRASPGRPIATAPGASATPSASRPSAPSPEAEFGIRGGPLAEHAPRVKEIAGTVAKIGRLPRGRLMITLDNGQTWEQNEPVDYFPLAVGDHVRIRAAALGSYMLYAPFKRATRVSRVR